jgi:hypothetical protein
MQFAMVRQMKKELGQLDKWLDAAVAFAGTKNFDPNLFLQFRLAPDQFAFVRQVQNACDTAKMATARLAGREWPKHDDKEATIDELHARVRSVIGYLEEFSEKELDEAATRTITNPRWNGKTMTGAEYFIEQALPNFFFHLTHAYAILRHNGVPLGKMDYLGPLPLR